MYARVQLISKKFSITIPLQNGTSLSFTSTLNAQIEYQVPEELKWFESSLYERCVQSTRIDVERAGLTWPLPDLLPGAPQPPSKSI
jgi:hypothetical protein